MGAGVTSVFPKPFYVQLLGFGGDSPCYCESFRLPSNMSAITKERKQEPRAILPHRPAVEVKKSANSAGGKGWSLKYLKGASPIYFRRWQLRRVWEREKRATFSFICCSGIEPLRGERTLQVDVPWTCFHLHSVSCYISQENSAVRKIWAALIRGRDTSNRRRESKRLTQCFPTETAL